MGGRLCRVQGDELNLMAEGFRKPTQKTIADIMGLAVTTVSRALQDDPKIAEATRQKVAKVAKEIGYVPDRAAQRLRTGKTKAVSFILNPHDEILGFGNAMISGLSQALKGTDYQLTITPFFTEEDEVVPIRNIVRNRLADCIVLTRTRNFDERIRYLLEQEFPFICHGRTDFSQGHSYVDFDNESFAYRAAHRLAAKGCGRLVILLPPDSFTFHQHLRYGFMKAICELGLDYIIPTDISLDSPADQCKAWLMDAYNDGVMDDQVKTGFVCPGETSYLALAASMRDLEKVRAQDFEAVVKTNSSILAQIDPSIDVIVEDIQKAGFDMGQGLLALLADPDTGPVQHLQEPRLQFVDGVG